MRESKRGWASSSGRRESIRRWRRRAKALRFAPAWSWKSRVFRKRSPRCLAYCKSQLRLASTQSCAAHFPIKCLTCFVVFTANFSRNNSMKWSTGIFPGGTAASRFLTSLTICRVSRISTRISPSSERTSVFWRAIWRFRCWRLPRQKISTPNRRRLIGTRSWAISTLSITNFPETRSPRSRLSSPLTWTRWASTGAPRHSDFRKTTRKTISGGFAIRCERNCFSAALTSRASRLWTTPSLRSRTIVRLKTLSTRVLRVDFRLLIWARDQIIRTSIRGRCWNSSVCLTVKRKQHAKHWHAALSSELRPETPRSFSIR